MAIQHEAKAATDYRLNSASIRSEAEEYRLGVDVGVSILDHSENMKTDYNLGDLYRCLRVHAEWSCRQSQGSVHSS